MALYLKKELENKAEIAVWQITETEEELKTLSSTPSDEMEEISWIKSETMRKQRLAVRALLNELFDEKVYLSHHDNGKPFLENRVTNISITHTDKYVAVILHDTEDVGIDIESLDRDFSAVELKALSEDEIEDLGDLQEAVHLQCGFRGADRDREIPSSRRGRTGGYIRKQGRLRGRVRTGVHDLRQTCPRLGGRIVWQGTQLTKHQYITHYRVTIWAALYLFYLQCRC